MLVWNIIQTWRCQASVPDLVMAFKEFPLFTASILARFMRSITAPAPVAEPATSALTEKSGQLVTYELASRCRQAFAAMIPAHEGPLSPLYLARPPGPAENPGGLSMAL